MKKKISNWDKDNFLQTLQTMLEYGNTNYENIIDIQLTFFQTNKKKAMVVALGILKKQIREGYKLSDALRNSGIINDNEFQILEKATTIAKGIDRIRNMNKEDNKIYVGFILLLAPPLVLLTSLLIGRPYIEKVLVDMTKPIVDAGGTPKPLPAYLRDDKIFIMWNMFAYGITIAYFSMLYTFKKSNPKKFFELMPLMKYKYAKEILENITALIDTGLNISEATEILGNIEKDNIKKGVYHKINKNLSKGIQNPISTVIDDYGLGLIIKLTIEINEINKTLQDGLNMALREAETKYTKFIGIFMKSAFWGGQILMMASALKPLVDILLYTSIAQLDFTI